MESTDFGRKKERKKERSKAIKIDNDKQEEVKERQKMI